MKEKLYRIKYKIVNYTFHIEGDEDLYAEMEIKEEIVNESELTRIEMQAEDGLTIIEEKELLNPELLPSMERIIEFVDKKGKHLGWGLRSRTEKRPYNGDINGDILLTKYLNT